MAPRANWKGFLRLSLVTCPVALYPATSESEKISFNQLNRKTGHRIKYMKVDSDTGEEVANEDIVKGYALDKDTFIEVTKEELEEVALESTRTIEIDEFGRTLHSRWRPEGSGADLFERVHDELAGDAWLVGRVTGQEKGQAVPCLDERNFSARALVRPTRRESLWHRARCPRQNRLGPLGDRW